MKLIPFSKVIKVPLYSIDSLRPQKFIDLMQGMDLADIAKNFKIEIVDSLLYDDKGSVCTYALESNLRIDYNLEYKIKSIEFRFYKSIFSNENLEIDGVNLFQNTLLSIIQKLNEKNIKHIVTDVGIDILEWGVSYFSSDFENDFDVKIDAVAISFI